MRLYSLYRRKISLQPNETMNLSESESVPDYLNKNIFPALLDAMEEMLREADRRKVLEVKYDY